MIHLHVHTSKGSLLDSTNRVEDLVARAKELNMDALAVTDHGYTSSLIDFYQECKNNDIKPILGCEVYVCDDMKIQDPKSRYDHLILLAKNKIGYENLLKISSLGFLEGFYYKPRVDIETISKYKEGLIVSTACLGGTIPKMILNKEPIEKIIDVIKYYNKQFEDFYLEIQSADNPEQELVNKTLANISDNLNIPLVVTSDVHFLKKEDFELHRIFIQINQDRDNEVYQDCWMKSESEVFDVISKQIGMEKAIEAISNTHKIADMCNVEIELGKSYLPKYNIPKQFKNEDEYLKYLINQGFVERGINKLDKDKLKIYIDRAKEEYEVITTKGFSGYFLIVQDFLKECKNKNIYIGDGRGSANNSLVCYLIGITNVDPIKYDLNFSRFLTLERTELPDIDTDVGSSHKADIISILREKYGYDNVVQIATFQTMQSKACLDKVGKVLEIPYSEITNIKKYVPDGVKLKDALDNNPHLSEYKEKYPKLFKYCINLEGLFTAISIHAGGVVICPLDRKINEFIALCFGSNKEIISQVEMHNIEAVGLVKMDILATNTLDIIDYTLDLIESGVK